MLLLPAHNEKGKASRLPILVLLITIALTGMVGYALSEASDTGTVNIEVNTVTTIDVSQTPMAFAFTPGTADENGSSDAPFELQNTGSVDIDVSICATAIAWSGTVGASDKNYYRFMADQNEASSCSTISQEGNSWVDINATSSGSIPLCETFNVENTTDSIKVGIKILPPSDEPDATSTSSTVTFHIANDTTAAIDSDTTC